MAIARAMGIPIKEAAEKIKIVAEVLAKHNMFIDVDEGVTLHPLPGKKIEDMEAGTAQITIAFLREIKEAEK